jgi:hypothetical protein
MYNQWDKPPINWGRVASIHCINKKSSTHALHIASDMKAPESGASSATAAPSEETPKAAVPSEAQLGLVALLSL